MAGFSSGLGRSTVGRRRLLGGAALAAGSAAFAAACGGGSKSRSDSGSSSAAATPAGAGLATVTTGQAAPGAADQPKRGGTMVIINDTPRSLDPHLDTLQASTFVPNNIYNGLLQFSPDLTSIQPELATALPEQPDPTTFVFKIRQGVKYHNIPPANGRELTAEDVKWSIERQSTNQAGKFQHAYYFLNRIASIEATDKYTLRFKMVKPYAPFLSYVASPWTMILNREQVEKDGDATQAGIGTGPFIFDEWQKGVSIKMRRNPDYWEKDQFGTQLPYVDGLQQKIATDTNAIQAQFVNGDVLAAGIQFTFKDEVKKKLPKANYRAIPSQFPKQMRTSPYDGDKIAQKKPYTDIRVRQALVQAVNKQEVLDLVYSGDGIVIRGPIIPIYKTWALTDELVKNDIADSKQLLAAAGFPNGFDDEMIFASNDAGDISSQVAEVLKNQLAKIGVRVALKPMDTTSYYNKTYAYDYSLSHHTPLNNPDPDENLASYFGRTSTYFKWGNKEIWDLIDKQAETLDQAERVKIVTEAQKRVVQDYPMSFIYTYNNHLFTQSKVKGWFFSNDLYNQRLGRVWIDPSA